FEDLTVGGDGNVVATGDFFPSGPDATLKYEGTTGNVLWGPVSLSSGSNFFSTFQVLTDAASNILQMGYSSSGAYVVKYSGIDGSILWGPTALPGFGLGLTRMTLDGSGNVYVAGFLCDSMQCYYEHAAVIKVAGATGVVLWGPSVYASGPQQNDYPE